MPIITDEAKIEELQEKFEKKLSVNTKKIPNLNIGYRGDSSKNHDGFYSKDLNMWFYFGKHTLSGNDGKPRYWNVFGLGEPKQTPNDIICEIDFTKEVRESTDRSFFFVDEYGKVSVYHNGRFTIHKGITIEFFLDNYKYKDKIEQIAGKKMVLVGILDSDDFANKVKEFVSEVERIKNLRKNLHNIQ